MTIIIERIPGNAQSTEQAGRVSRVLQAALAAADPRAAVRRSIQLSGDTLAVEGQTFDLRSGRVRVVGVGKASLAMTQGVLDVLGEQVAEGLVIAKHLPAPSQDRLPDRIRVMAGNHPVPDIGSVSSASALVDFLKEDASTDDLVICLISGGGSALMVAPQEGIDLADMQALTRLLLACGADITEINTLRKHLDRVKGGGLARLAAPARLVTLILSDVIGSPLDVIASGPTVADPTTYQDALAILNKYKIEAQAPQPIRTVLEQGAAGWLAETVKPGDELLKRVTNRVVTSNLQAAEAALAQAEREGFHSLLLTTYLQGEASQAGVVLAGILQQVAASGHPLARPACIVAGGETTVTLRGSGLGGRNQELALGAISLLAGLADVALVTLGTDGEDGPTDAAGAIVSGQSLARARALGLDPLAALQTNDSYHFFEALGDLLRPGPTGTNVNDLVFLFAF